MERDDSDPNHVQVPYFMDDELVYVSVIDTYVLDNQKTAMARIAIENSDEI